MNRPSRPSAWIVSWPFVKPARRSPSRAWHPAQCLQPTIAPHTPLTFDVVELGRVRSIGGCRYHVAHPGGRAHGTFPVNALEAGTRRLARFETIGHMPGPMPPRAPGTNSYFPHTLDLRRAGF
jgi:uncharacterized protein (DUF2126 family)